MSEDKECKHSDYKLCFKLKQHTPIIHFQAKQKGATLRATELKPKLDRFLIKELDLTKIVKINNKYKEVPKKEYVSWFIGEGKKHLALDYKVSIEGEDIKGRSVKNKAYFGNMGKKPNDKEYKEQIFSHKEINVKFLFLKTDIKLDIEKYFSSFLVITNFGTRQSKGFGGYYLDVSDPNYVKPINALDKISSKYIYADYDDSSTVFSHVEAIYPLMKTGINFPDYPTKDHPKGITNQDGTIKQVPDSTKPKGENAFYYKSYLFQYMLEQEPSIGNEKRFIKETFFNEDIQLLDDDKPKKYVRAMLGVSDGVDFKDKDRYGKIEYESSDIKRFKSPLTFKIIDKSLYIIANRIPTGMYNLKFSFSDKFTKDNIWTPKEFNLVKFLYSFADYFNELPPLYKYNRMAKKIKLAKKTTFIKAQS